MKIIESQYNKKKISLLRNILKENTKEIIPAIEKLISNKVDIIEVNINDKTTLKIYSMKKKPVVKNKDENKDDNKLEFIINEYNWIKGEQEVEAETIYNMSIFFWEDDTVEDILSYIYN